jgi:hypothetical protein
MNTCLGTQILRDADSAKLFRDLCRGTSRFCEEGQPCPRVLDEARILLVSSRRSPASTPRRTAPAAEASAEPLAVIGPRRSSEAGP